MYFPFLSLEWIILTWKKCGGRRRTDRNYILFNIFGKRKKEMQMKGQRGFGQDVWKRDSRRFLSEGKKGKKKLLPFRFRKRISEVGVYRRIRVRGNHYFSANVLSVFFFFVDSCWKGEFLSWHEHSWSGIPRNFLSCRCDQREGRRRGEEADRERGK